MDKYTDGYRAGHHDAQSNAIRMFNNQTHPDFVRGYWHGYFKHIILSKPNKPHTILLDMDGVMFNWLDAAINLCVPDQHDDIKQQIIESQFSLDLKNFITKKQVWKQIDRAGAEFWANLQLFPWSKELWKLCNELTNGNTYFCTAPSRHPSCVKGKVQAIQKHFKTDKYVLTSHKWLCANSHTILIDDSPPKLESFAKAGGRILHWPHQYSIDPNTFNVKQFILDAIYD